MQSTTSRFGRNRPEWLRDEMRKRFARTHRHGGSIPRTSPFDASRRHHIASGLRFRAWELSDVEPEIFSHQHPMPPLPENQSGNGVSTADDEGAQGLHVVPLQEPEVQPLRPDPEL